MMLLAGDLDEVELLGTARGIKNETMRRKPVEIMCIPECTETLQCEHSK